MGLLGSDMELEEKNTYIVFSDLKGFSKLKLEEQERYITVNVLLLSQNIKPFLNKALVSNTWGDAIIAVFENGDDATNFMLSYRDGARNSMPSVSNKQLLPRIAGHYGKVKIFNDPLLKKKNIISDVVNTTARIEPVTRPGEIFVTKEFQAAFEMQFGNQTAVKFEPLGMIPLAKNYGEWELYRLIKKTERSHIIDMLFEKGRLPAVPGAPELSSLEKNKMDEFENLTEKEQIQTFLEKEWTLDHTGTFAFEIANKCKDKGLYEEGIKWVERAREYCLEFNGVKLYPFKNKIVVIQLKANLLTRLEKFDLAADLLYSLWINLEGGGSSKASDILASLAAQFKRRALMKDNKYLPKEEVDKDVLEKAANLYLEAFRHNIEDHYPAINAAFLLVMLGDKNQKGKKLAQHIKDTWGKDSEKGKDYWLDLSLAQAELLHGYYEDAVIEMEYAIETHKGKIGVFEIESTLLQITHFLNFVNAESEGEELVNLLKHHLKLKQVQNV
jgi:class 3 adenylate cyclase